MSSVEICHDKENAMLHGTNGGKHFLQSGTSTTSQGPKSKLFVNPTAKNIPKRKALCDFNFNTPSKTASDKKPFVHRTTPFVTKPKPTQQQKVTNKQPSSKVKLAPLLPHNKPKEDFDEIETMNRMEKQSTESVWSHLFPVIDLSSQLLESWDTTRRIPPFRCADLCPSNFTHEEVELFRVEADWNTSQTAEDVQLDYMEPEGDFDIDDLEIEVSE